MKYKKSKSCGNCAFIDIFSHNETFEKGNLKYGCMVYPIEPPIEHSIVHCVVCDKHEDAALLLLHGK